MIFVEKNRNVRDIVIKSIIYNDSRKNQYKNPYKKIYFPPFFLKLHIPDIDIISYNLPQHYGKITAQITIDK